MNRLHCLFDCINSIPAHSRCLFEAEKNSDLNISKFTVKIRVSYFSHEIQIEVNDNSDRIDNSGLNYSPFQ